MGRISAPFGIRGWVKIEPFTSAPANLLAYPRWAVGEGDGWRTVRVERGEVHGASVIAKLAECDDRDAAARLRGLAVAVERSALPLPGENEYYQADLAGLAVVNAEGVALGHVARILETGANDVLVVEGERERLIPFIAHVVCEVDVAGGVIRVDWAADY